MIDLCFLTLAKYVQLDVPCQLTTWEDFLKTEDWQHILNTQDDGVAMM